MVGYMPYNPNHHRRRSIRLPAYDYSGEGWYFITICSTDNKQCLFGDINNERMVLSDCGKIIKHQWVRIPKRFNNVILDDYIIMPNHIHGIIEIIAPVGAIHESPLHQRLSSIIPLRDQRRQMTLSKIIGYFKMNSAKQINCLLQRQGNPVWQRNYYERIIRDDRDYVNICGYMKNNPGKWAQDRNYLN
ncbi:hypothetical protein HY933_02430 [Candidatus Falkowbacteria bacterium]|nr:hypothetical protein [Candidatus Falkowbacteria bacterium]